MKTLEHTWSDWITAILPTSTSTGEQRRNCTVCGKTDFQTIPKLNSNTNSYATELIRLINVERTKSGLSELITNSTLTDYADTRSQKYANDKSLDNPQLYIRNTLMKSYEATYGGEIWGGGATTPEMAMTYIFMQNTTFKNVILNSSAKYIGASYYVSGGTPYWVVDFAG